MKKLLFVLAFLPLILMGQTALANEEKIGVTAPIDATDYASLQRGAKTFVNNCLNCHSANYMRYNRLKDIGLTEQQIKDNLLFAGEKVGDTMSVAMSPKDAKKWFGVAPPDLSVEVRARGADWVYENSCQRFVAGGGARFVSTGGAWCADESTGGSD